VKQWDGVVWRLSMIKHTTKGIKKSSQKGIKQEHTGQQVAGRQAGLVLINSNDRATQIIYTSSMYVTTTTLGSAALHNPVIL
jgi:hypothetical protein